MVCTLFENEAFVFTLQTRERENAKHISAGEKAADNGTSDNHGASGFDAMITRRSRQSGEETVLFSYAWPVQLTVEVKAGEGTLRDDGVLCWELFVTAHHVTGMAKGEFTETERFEVENPFGTAQELVCRTVDVVRKTRFAIAERHLGHMPHQTYPSVDGRQGPYGHP